MVIGAGQPTTTVEPLPTPQVLTLRLGAFAGKMFYVLVTTRSSLSVLRNPNRRNFL